MRIGRLEFGIVKGGSDWNYYRGFCECRILSLGKVYLTWLSKTCKCSACNQYLCVCKCEKCCELAVACVCEDKDANS